MNVLLYILIVYLALNVVVWLRRHLDLSAGRRSSTILDHSYPLKGDADGPSVSMIVAGRNESANIERCLLSLVGQRYDKLHVIAVNDRSDDDTGAIMERLAAGAGGRLSVYHVDEVQPGWLGKPNAMRIGVEHAGGELLCFTDADCDFLCPDTIGIAVHYAGANGVDFLSILPVLETSGFWEKVLQPVCSAIMMLWFRPERVNDPADRRAYANGAFMLMTRRAYDAIGGHAAARDKVNEDMEFARLAKARGVRLNVVRNGGLYRTRMYDSFRATFRGWSRIFYGCFASLPVVVGAAVLLTLMSVAPYLVFAVSLALTAVNGFDLSQRGWVVLTLAAAALVAQISVIVRFYRMTGLSWRRALSYPLGAPVAVAMLLSAAGKFLGQSITWRGRTISTKTGAAPPAGPGDPRKK